MRIKHDEMIAGQPALVMRKLMKIGQSSSINLDDVMRICQVSQEAAVTIIGELITEGYIAVKEETDAWDSTELGNALSMASVRSIKRLTAEKLLKEFLERVEDINRNDEFVYMVQQVVVFGSYLSDIPELGDVDIAVELVLRWQVGEELDRKRKECIQQAYKDGRTFSSPMDELMWPHVQVLLFLKKRSAYISLHDITDDILNRKQTKKEVIYVRQTK